MKIILNLFLIFIMGTVANAEGVPVKDAKIQKIENVFNGLNASTMNLVAEFYAADALFEDPLGSHNGVESIRKYYENLYKNVTSIRFDFSDHICQGNTCVSVWTMHLSAKSLNSGNPTTLKGNSYIKFNDAGMVQYHRDYFDMGEFIYEHIPILKNVITFVKKQLKS